ncbi:MAG: guanylate kinase [Deltaproteobacteria bacterium]|nr:guanylate kinase [Deltaproteobacteria bacterium]
MNPGLLLVLSAPSGAGKTTLAHRLVQALPEAVFSISATTRPPRGEEQDGRDYHFLSPWQFQEKIDQGEFVEFAEVFGYRYGTLHQTLQKALDQGQVAIFDIDVQGGSTIKSKYPGAVTVFIFPPSMEELERRLRARKTDTDEVIRKRLAAAREEMVRGHDSYDYLIVNDDLNRAFDDLLAVIRAERLRRTRVDVSRTFA